MIPNILNKIFILLRRNFIFMMKNKKQRIQALVLSASLLAAVLPITPSGAEQAPEADTTGLDGQRLSDGSVKTRDGKTEGTMNPPVGKSEKVTGGTEPTYKDQSISDAGNRSENESISIRFKDEKVDVTENFRIYSSGGQSDFFAKLDQTHWFKLTPDGFDKIKELVHRFNGELEKKLHRVQTKGMHQTIHYMERPIVLTPDTTLTTLNQISWAIALQKSMHAGLGVVPIIGSEVPANIVPVATVVVPDHVGAAAASLVHRAAAAPDDDKSATPGFSSPSGVPTSGEPTSDQSFTQGISNDSTSSIHPNKGLQDDNTPKDNAVPGTANTDGFNLIAASLAVAVVALVGLFSIRLCRRNKKDIM